MFLAGFVFVTIFNWLTSSKMELYLVGIWSLFVNALIKNFFSVLHSFMLKTIDFNENIKIVIYVFSAIITATFFSKLYNGNWARRNLSRLGKKTLGNNVFKDVVDFDKKTILLIYLNNSEFFYSGTFKYMDEHDSDSYIALIDYSIFNHADNKLIRDNSGNKMTILFCLRDVEHIELLYEEDSEVWQMLGGSVEKNEVKKGKKGKEYKVQLILQKVLNRIGFAIPFIVFCVQVGILCWLLLYQSVPKVANSIDFFVAVMSAGVLIISYACRKMSKRQQFVWVSPIYVTLLLIGLCIPLTFPKIVSQDISSISRVLSCVCLGATIIQEIIEMVKIEREICISDECKLEEKLRKCKLEDNTKA